MTLKGSWTITCKEQLLKEMDDESLVESVDVPQRIECEVVVGNLALDLVDDRWDNDAHRQMLGSVHMFHGISHGMCCRFAVLFLGPVEGWVVGLLLLGVPLPTYLYLSLHSNAMHLWKGWVGVDDRRMLPDSRQPLFVPHARTFS